MSKLERYIAKEVIPSFVIGTAFYVFLLIFQSLVGRGQWLSYFSAAAIGRWMFWQIPDSALKAFPLAIVFAVLIVFGRLARDNELLAASAGGISLARATRPVIAFGGLLVLLGLVLAEFVVPKANEKVSVTWWDSAGGGGRALERLAGKLINTGRGQLYFKAFDASTQSVQDVRFEEWDESARVQTLTFATSGKLENDQLILQGPRTYQYDFTNPNPNLNLQSVLKPQNRTIKKLEKDRDALINQNAGGGFEDSRSITTLFKEWQVANQKTEGGREARETAVQLGVKTALPFANLVILLLAIPVAASSSRSSSVALGMALLIAGGYYVALFAGQALGQNQLVPAFLGPWLANIAFLIAGFWTIRRRQFR